MSGLERISDLSVYGGIAVVLVFLGTYLLVYPLIAGLVRSLMQIDRQLVIQLAAARSSAEFTALLTWLGRTFAWLGFLTPGHTARMEQLMLYAGRPFGGLPATRYVAALWVLGVMIGGVLAAMALIWGGIAGDGDARIGLAVVCLFGVPFSLQVFAWGHMNGLARSVGDEITICFPFFLDLAVLVVQAGGLPQETFEQYIEAAPDTALAREFRVAVREAEAVSVEVALLRLTDRIESATIKTILRNLSQAQRSSGNLSAFYAEQAVELRSIRIEIAETAINAMKQKLKIPEFMLACAIALAVIAPALTQMDVF